MTLIQEILSKPIKPTGEYKQTGLLNSLVQKPTNEEPKEAVKETPKATEAPEVLTVKEMEAAHELKLSPSEYKRFRDEDVDVEDLIAQRKNTREEISKEWERERKARDAMPEEGLRLTEDDRNAAWELGGYSFKEYVRYLEGESLSDILAEREKKEKEKGKDFDYKEAKEEERAWDVAIYGDFKKDYNDTMTGESKKIEKEKEGREAQARRQDNWKAPTEAEVLVAKAEAKAELNREKVARLEEAKRQDEQREEQAQREPKKTSTSY